MFTIQSSLVFFFQTHPNEIHVLLAVVRYKTKLVKPREGLCSNWLARMHPNKGRNLIYVEFASGIKNISFF